MSDVQSPSQSEVTALASPVEPAPVPTVPTDAGGPSLVQNGANGPPAPQAGEQPGNEQPGDTHFWLRRGDQAFVAVLTFVGLILLGWHAVRLGGWNNPPVEIERLPASQYAFRVDINRATWIEWAQLDGIGETLARRIVADREERGPFRTVDDIRRVRGIGPKKLEQIRPWLELPERE